MPSEVRAEDWKPTPREPEQDRDPFGTSTDPRNSWRLDRNTEVLRGPVPTIRLAANDEPQGGSKQRFDIPAGDLESALITFSRQTGIQSLYPSELVAGRRTSGVQGDYTPEEALQGILAGAGLQYQFSDAKTVVLHPVSRSEDMSPPDPAMSQAENKPVKVPEVVVKEKKERPTWTTPVDGYKADHASTVTRSTMSIDETPTSIGVVTRDIIRDTFARSQADAFESVSGIARGTSRVGRGEEIHIRGFQTNNILGSFNGVKANGLPTDGVFAPDWGIVERYEIVKGPASIIGGAATPGGVINRITKTPRRENFATSEFQAGSYGFLRGLVDANGVLPAHEDVRGRLVFAVEEGGHFVDNTPVRQYSVAPSVELDLFKNAGKLLLVGTFQDFNGASYPGWPLSSDGTMLNVPRTRNFGGGAPNGARTQYTGYNGELHYDHKFIQDIKLSVKGKYSNSTVSDKILYGYSFGGVPRNGDSPVLSKLWFSRFDTYAGEFSLGKEFEVFGRKHEILAGADHRHMTQNTFNGYAYLPVGSAPILDNVFNPRNAFQAPSDALLEAAAVTSRTERSRLNQTGAFAQAVTRPTDRLTLVFAGRFDSVDSNLLNKATGLVADQTASQWTGRAGATFRVMPWMNVYAGLQQSFQPQPFAFTQNGAMLPPETGINYEIGAKFNFLDERVRITTAFFRTYRENVSTIDPTNPRFAIAVGEQRHQGVELDMNGQPIPGLNLNVNFAYLEAEITQDNRPAFIGSSPLRVPQPFVGRLFATYQIQSGFLRGFGFGGGIYGQSGAELAIPNTVKTEAYQRVDAVLFYRGSKQWDVAVNVRNLTNATYIESPGFLSVYNVFGAPISAFGTVRVYF